MELIATVTTSSASAGDAGAPGVWTPLVESDEVLA